MPLEPFERGNFWWVRGRIDYNGLPISDYYRQSTGASTEAGANEWIRVEETAVIRRYLIGEETPELTLGDAIGLYPAKPYEAHLLIKILKVKGDDLAQKPVSDITGKYLRELGKELKPNCATDTMWREVVSPLRAVINNAHDLNPKTCPHLHVKRYSEQERITQDIARGKQSRVERTPATKDWIDAFCAAADPWNAAMLRFMFETAARIDQATSITPDDLDLANRLVRLKAQKGHPEQWITISHDMMVELANLKPKRPKNFKTGKFLDARVFGHASSTRYNTRWKKSCKDAGIPYLSAHAAGRHAYFTELTVRQGVNATEAAKAGRWKDASLPLRVYAHAEQDEDAIRARFRTQPVQSSAADVVKGLELKRKSKG